MRICHFRDRFLPDKAIDLVDEAAARLKIQVSSKPIQLDRLDRLLLQLEMERISILGDSKARALDEQEKLRLRAVESQIERLQAQQVLFSIFPLFACVSCCSLWSTVVRVNSSLCFASRIHAVLRTLRACDACVCGLFVVPFLAFDCAAPHVSVSSCAWIYMLAFVRCCFSLLHWCEAYIAAAVSDPAHNLLLSRVLVYLKLRRRLPTPGTKKRVKWML